MALACSLLSAGLLAGCDQGAKFAPACPQLALLRDAADITRFRASGQDLTDLVLDGRITAVPAACSAGEHGTVKAQMKVSMDLTRGPAASGRVVVVPYFVAVTDGDRVLDEQDYALAASFPPNTDKVTGAGEDITLNFPVSAQKSAAAYKIFVGFRLAPEELAYNRKRGPR